jgi:heme exporter protein A
MLSAQQLALRRGDEWLFKNLSFTVGPGQLLWLRGQNGRGKTSLLRLVVGLAQADDGQITWAGEPLRKSHDFHNQLVYLGHASGLKEDLTAHESLQFLACLHQRDSGAQRLDAVLRRLAIHHRRNRQVRTLSQGQRKRVTLARLALEDKPSLWVLDEPFDALDSDGIDIVNRLIEEHLERQGSVLLTSHLTLSLKGAGIQELDLDKACSS